ncbi:MAG: class D sortase [Lachnospiraceae bacterium]
MAYIVWPLFFTILGYGIVYLAARPFIEIGSAAASVFLSSRDTAVATSVNKEVFDIQDPLQPVQTDTAAVETVQSIDIDRPSYGDLYGHLVCERIGLDTDVYYGDDYYILREGAGQYIGSSLPGGTRPTLLAGHNITTFAPLQNIQAGDIINFATAYAVYQYQVTETKILSANDTTAYDLLTPREQLILYTCYPFATLGSLQQRYFVYADKISGPTIE